MAPKGKKKGQKMALTDFLASGTSWADSEPEQKQAAAVEAAAKINPLYSLPTAPKAARALENMPSGPPYVAFVGNIPFQLEEENLHQFFEKSQIKNVRIPTDRETGRIKGVAFVEFEDVESLRNALQLDGNVLLGRSVKVDLAEGEQTDRERSRGGGIGSDSRYSGRDDERTAGDWRSQGPPPAPVGGRSGYGSRGSMGDDVRGGSRGYGSRSGGFGSRDDGFGSSGSLRQERPRLHLQPRSKPVESTDNVAGPGKTDTGSSQDLFGGARPVDTAQREREIEERLARERGSGEGAAEEEEKKHAAALKSNPFGSAKPVDTAQKEREIEEKLEAERRERAEAAERKRAQRASQRGPGAGAGDEPAETEGAPTAEDDEDLEGRPVATVKMGGNPFGTAKPVDTAQREREIEEKLKADARKEREARRAARETAEKEKEKEKEGAAESVSNTELGGGFKDYKPRRGSKGDREPRRGSKNDLRRSGGSGTRSNRDQRRTGEGPNGEPRAPREKVKDEVDEDGFIIRRGNRSGFAKKNGSGAVAASGAGGGSSEGADPGESSSGPTPREEASHLTSAGKIRNSFAALEVED
eukprot:Clim_evm15s250 gene=Clim_evmTU15s250